MRILSISTVFPNEEEPGLGLFVRARLESLARLEPCVAVAPVPMVDFARPAGRWLRRAPRPAARRDGALTVLHPRWLYPPGGTPLTALCLFLRLAALLVRLRRRVRFDVIDAHFGYPEGVAAALVAKLFRVPLVVTLRGSETAFAAYRWRRLAMRWALRRAAAVIVVSEPLRRFAVSMGARRVATIPNGIDAGVFQPGGHEAARAALGIGPEKRVVVSAGELIEAKGHHLVIGAAAALLRQGRPIEVFIAGAVSRGGRPFERELRGLAGRLGVAGHVHFTGWLERRRLAELLAAADVFCLASFAEGWPNVVHEAMACGTPVVASRVGAIPEMIPDERYGLTVPARDEAALGGALARALETEWDRAAIAARGQSRSWSEVAREAVRVLQGCRAASGAAAPESARHDHSTNLIDHVRD